MQKKISLIKIKSFKTYIIPKKYNKLFNKKRLKICLNNLLRKDFGLKNKIYIKEYSLIINKYILASKSKKKNK